MNPLGIELVVAVLQSSHTAKNNGSDVTNVAKYINNEPCLFL